MLAMLAQDASIQAQAIAQGFWQAAFDLIALSIVAFSVHVVHRRWRARADARQELVDEIDEFTIRLYRPRKMYQLILDRKVAGCAGATADVAAAWEAERLRFLVQTLDGLVETIGRFRAVQVKLVPLFGYHEDLFAHYLAIWRYLKEIRKRMELGVSLHDAGAPDATDAFYRLIDSFRYRVQTERYTGAPPRRVQPSPELLERAQARATAIYEAHFSAPPTA